MGRVVYSSAMMGQAPKRILILLLGMWVALAPAIYAAPATAMAVQSGIGDGAQICSHGCCPEDKVERSACQDYCLNAVQSAIAASAGEVARLIRLPFEPQPMNSMLNICSAPDPAPPKPSSLL